MDSRLTWIVIVALIGGGVLIYQLAMSSAQRRRQLDDPGAPREVDELYAGLRLGALTESLGRLGLVAKGEGVKAFGLVIDLGLHGGIVTLSTLITGDINLYASDGGGALGAPDEPEIKAAAVTAIKRAESVMAGMPATKTFPLPSTGQARFYLLLSNRTVAAAEDTIERLVSGEAALSPAWNAAHKVFERFGITAQKSPA